MYSTEMRPDGQERRYSSFVVHWSSLVSNDPPEAALRLLALFGCGVRGLLLVLVVMPAWPGDHVMVCKYVQYSLQNIIQYSPAE